MEILSYFAIFSLISMLRIGSIADELDISHDACIDLRRNLEKSFPEIDFTINLSLSIEILGTCQNSAYLKISD